MTIIMAVIGCACFNQYAVITILVRVLEEGRVPDFVMFLSHWLLVANSFIDVILYVAMNQTFRDRGKELLQTVTSRVRVGFCVHVLPSRRKNVKDVDSRPVADLA